MTASLDLRQLCAVYVSERCNVSATARRVEQDWHYVKAQLRDPEAQRIVAELQAELLEQYKVSAMRVVGEAAAIAFSDLPRIMREARTIEQLNELDPHLRAAVAELHVDEHGNIQKLKLHPKLPALSLLADYSDIGGLGAAGEATSSRPELGGLTIIGGTDTEAKNRDTTRRKAIPQPRRVD